jgi:hypothetical protein
MRCATKHLRKITKFVEARHDPDFLLSSRDFNVSVATPSPRQSRAEYGKS